jgi:hypothetical protein
MLAGALAEVSFTVLEGERMLTRDDVIDVTVKGLQSMERDDFAKRALFWYALRHVGGLFVAEKRIKPLRSVGIQELNAVQSYAVCAVLIELYEYDQAGKYLDQAIHGIRDLSASQQAEVRIFAGKLAKVGF